MSLESPPDDRAPLIECVVPLVDAELVLTSPPIVTSPRSSRRRSCVRSLGDDLASGRWADRNPDLVDLEAAELGARLLIA
jgi:hypothetical protein